MGPTTYPALTGISNAGVFWVQAAGELALRHWQGTYTDNGSGFAVINGGDGGFVTPPAGEFRAYLSWFETAGAVTSQTYDLQLYQGATLIADSAVTHDGTTPPISCSTRRYPRRAPISCRLKP